MWRIIKKFMICTGYQTWLQKLREHDSDVERMPATRIKRIIVGNLREGENLGDQG